MNSERGRLLWQATRIRLHRLSVLPALLICYAVVLNVGPFARLTQGQPIHAISVANQTVAAAAVGRASDHAVDEAEVHAAIAPSGFDAQPSLVTLVGLAPMTPLASLPVSDAATAQPATPALASEVEVIQPAPTPVDLRARDVAADDAPVAGIWAPSASACSLRDLRDGWLPTIIDADGARAGDTFCAFSNRKQTAAGWRVVATCSDSHHQWTATVRLSVKDDHLIWSSAHGRQEYTRCAPDSMMTAAR